VTGATAAAGSGEMAAPPPRQLGRARSDRDALVLAHLGLLNQVARQLRLTPTAVVDLDDYRSAGACGLLNAASEWDPAMGEFEPFARACIANAMRRQIRDIRWRKAGAPRPDRVLVSLDAPANRDGTWTVADTLEDEADGPGDELLRQAHKMQVLTVLSHLPDGDRALLHARYINDFRQDVTAALLGLTICQVQWRMQVARQRFARAWRAANADPDPGRATAGRGTRSIA
jgi:RNA polymerase sigma factor (sigma-70 family)